MLNAMMTPPKGWTWTNNGIGFLPLDNPVPYDKNYWNNYERLAGTDQGRIINRIRSDLVERWTPTGDRLLLDVGIGCGAFLQQMKSHTWWKVYGTDVNPVAIDWLAKHDMLMPTGLRARTLTFWDVLEHIPQPADVIEPHCAQWIFLSMPIYRDEHHALTSKHFKPGEHCWYFTRPGLESFMFNYRYELVEANKQETIIGGREDVWGFAFRRI